VRECRAMMDVATIRRALARFTPTRHGDPASVRWAAVAAVVRDATAGAELLFIHRAEDERDPWSGHMAFPGGRVDADDEGRKAAAVRETLEEVGLDLGRDGEFLGRLSDVAAVGRGRPLNLAIAPFVFAVAGAPRLEPNHEVADAVWVPFAYLADRTNRSTLRWGHGGGILLPCYRWRNKVIWGLTFGMVDELLEVVGG
jgi:8-oxo-dGTP pyrophosphatase MutT (NUDIX family)